MLRKQLTQFDRSAVVTIQGGAVFGFSMLGQLSALLNRHGIVPAAIAGNSAGAIVATLCWAGYQPAEIRELFLGLAKAPGLLSLLGDGKHSTRNLESRYKRMAGLAGAVNRRFKPRGERTWAEFFQVWSLDLIASPLHMWRAASYYKTRGIFEGRALENTIDEWIRSSPVLRHHQQELPKGLLRFSDVRLLARRKNIYFPPLVLTATNAAARKLVVFNSFEEEFGHVRIASAVRASAGFPGLFQPVEVAGAPEPGAYIDGGLITNYPSWVFSSELRERLAKTEQYRPLAARPWLHIGLRVLWEGTPADRADASPRGYVAGIKDLFLGGARTQLEAQMGPPNHSIVVAQPTSMAGGPKSFLDVRAVTAEVIGEMIGNGERFADQTLQGVSFELPGEELVTEQLSLLLQCIESLLKDVTTSDLSLRSNVFVAYQDRLILKYQVNMDGDEDANMDFHFTEGLAGFCYLRRCPHICSMKRLRALAASGKLDAAELFGMSSEQHEKVKADRAVLLSVPILDPAAIFARDLGEPWDRRSAVHKGLHYGNSPNPVDGAIFGVLNVDSAIDFSDLEVSMRSIHSTDVKLRGTIDLMQAAAWRLGRLFSDALGASKE